MRLLVIALLVAIIVAPATAQSILAGDVGADATEANSQPKLARDAGGTIYFVYAAPSGGVSQIYLARSSDGGTRWQVGPVTSGRVASRYPALTVDRQGSAHVAWTQYDGGSGKVYYARYDGRTWTAPVPISVGQTYAGIPAIAVDAGGTVHLVWYGIRPQAPAVRTRHGSIYEILYAHSDGTRWTPPAVISPGIPDAINPTLAVDAAGRLHSAWYQFDARVYQIRYAARERAWTPPLQVSSGGSDAAAVAMAVQADGTTHLVWEQRSDAGIRIFYAQKRPRWSGQELVSPPAQRACCPTVAVDGQGRVYVVWESNGQLHLRRRDGNWLGSERLTTQTGNHNPVLGATGSNVDLAWTQQIGQTRQVRFATISGGRTRGPAPATPLRGLIFLVMIVLLVIWVRRMRAIQRS